MERILSNPNKFFDIIEKLNNHECNLSFRKTTDKLNFDKVYDEVINYIENIDDVLNELDGYINSEELNKTNISYRIKSEESLSLKWDKNIVSKRPLKKVCNDIIGIRIITDLKSKELQMMDFNKFSAYNVRVVNFHKEPKSEDDGYRGIHIYLGKNSKCFPVEIQIWNQEDAILNFYTHEVIYKGLGSKDGKKYSKNLREWIDTIPTMPKEIDISTVEYLYRIIYSHIGGE